MTLYQLYLSRTKHMNQADQRQAYLLLDYLLSERAQRSIADMKSDQPDGFATEQ